MSVLVIYSTITGNTKLVCERIYNILNVEKKLIDVKEIESIKLDNYSDIIIGFWCDKGTMDKNSLEFLNKLKNKNLYFLGTLGARPESEHGKSVFINAKELCKKENNFVDGLLIWGRVSEAVQNRIKQFPADHPHGPTSERLARWKEASTHPDEDDLKKAEEFFSKLLNK